ncbi:MAG: endonuclease/exonuclease/phosphatase family protein [Anaerolineae bacterium]|nr:endonuclease/exonuclease/phosphatase family protein [Anaerolineae bacterium]
MNTESQDRSLRWAPMLAVAGATGALLWWFWQRGKKNLRITVATYNVEAYKQSLDSIIQVVRDVDAEIIAFQELSRELADRLTAEFALDYPYKALHPDAEDATCGQGILSRYPIRDSQYWQHTMGFQRAEIQVGTEMLTIFNSHPATPLTTSYEQRAWEIRDLLERASSVRGPLLLMGDFNMEEWSDDYKHITSHYHDTYAEAGSDRRRFTFPNALAGLPIISTFISPVVRLDYIFRNKKVHPLRVMTWTDSGGSDHLPLRAVLLLNPDKSRAR